MGNIINIVIVDDNKQLVEGLEMLLIKEKSFKVIGTANSGSELFELKNLAYTDIVLLDIEMPGMSGFDIAKKINWTLPSTKLIAITMYQEKVYLEKLVKVGFKGFVNKTEIVEKLIDVINNVMSGKLIFPNDLNL